MRTIFSIGILAVSSLQAEGQSQVLEFDLSSAPSLSPGSFHLLINQICAGNKKAVGIIVRLYERMKSRPSLELFISDSKYNRFITKLRESDLRGRDIYNYFIEECGGDFDLFYMSVINHDSE